jgi:hypothetical protein
VVRRRRLTTCGSGFNPRPIRIRLAKVGFGQVCVLRVSLCFVCCEYRYVLCVASIAMFCVLRVSLYFVWISEHTVIFSLYSINWLDFITEESVYCAVRTESFYVIPGNVSLWRVKGTLECCIWKFILFWERRLIAFKRHWWTGTCSADGVCCLGDLD